MNLKEVQETRKNNVYVNISEARGDSFLCMLECIPLAMKQLLTRLGRQPLDQQWLSCESDWNLWSMGFSTALALGAAVTGASI